MPLIPARWRPSSPGGRRATSRRPSTIRSAGTSTTRPGGCRFANIGMQESGSVSRSEAKPMRMLVTGASGQLARSLAALDDSTPGLSIVARGRPELDLTDPATLIAAIDRIRPDVVVNAAAYTAVDAAE